MKKEWVDSTRRRLLKGVAGVTLIAVLPALPSLNKAKKPALTSCSVNCTSPCPLNSSFKSDA
ncbi:MAG: hypothetical protein GX029_03300 [Pseudomonadaceae bacterium]|jgi:hypothetical protein|nr:hypothetical protein [Pseudomonadaceae bacterium]